ncbi:hypothetical protein H5410_003166, partial [Solanum commersonii]
FGEQWQEVAGKGRGEGPLEAEDKHSSPNEDRVTHPIDRRVVRESDGGKMKVFKRMKYHPLLCEMINRVLTYLSWLSRSPSQKRTPAKGIEVDLRIPPLRVAASRKIFVKWLISVIGVGAAADFTKESTFKKFRKGGEFSGSHLKGKVRGLSTSAPIQPSLRAFS